MSVYKPKGGRTFQYDFQYRGSRFHGSTGKTTKRAAEAFEEKKRQDVKAAIAATKGSMVTFAAAAAVYMLDRGQFEKNSAATQTWLADLANDLGAETYIHEINTSDVQNIIARRRATVSNATVNRSVTQLLQRVWNRIEKTNKGCTGDGLDFRALMLQEPKERIRELTQQEEKAVRKAFRKDVLPVFEWALVTGMRRAECLNLQWRDIDRRERVMTVLGKGDVHRVIPVTDQLLKILDQCKHLTDYVFTYEKQRTRDGSRGQRLRLTATVLRNVWNKARKDAGLEDFVWHDLRHTAATRLLRTSGNLALVQDLLGHEDITTTRKYAHSDVEDLRSAMEKSARKRARR